MYSATMRIAPWQQSNRTQYHAFYAQDQWTMGRADAAGRAAVTIAPGAGSRPSTTARPRPVSGTRRRSRSPKTDGVTGYNDITPRGGVAYDVFGNGKTSLKVNVGKYLQSANNQENYTIGNPALDGRNGRRGPNFQTTASRNVHRLRRRSRARLQHAADPQPNGECIAPDLGNFANPNALTQVNPAVLSGWGVRPYDWQFGVVGAARDPAAHLARSRLCTAAGSATSS